MSSVSPANGISEYGMQEARRLFADDSKLSGVESYRIQKEYPNECRIVMDIWLKEQGLVKEQSKIISAIVTFGDMCHKNQKKIYAACLLTVSALATVFFCPKRLWP